MGASVCTISASSSERFSDQIPLGNRERSSANPGSCKQARQIGHGPGDGRSAGSLGLNRRLAPLRLIQEERRYGRRRSASVDVDEDLADDASLDRLMSGCDVVERKAVDRQLGEGAGDDRPCDVVASTH